MRPYYAIDWHPLIVAAPYVAIAMLLAVVFFVEWRAPGWVDRPRVYDWQKDPAAVEDLAAEQCRIQAAWDRFAAAREACRAERRARVGLYGAGCADVIALRPVNDRHPAA